jgi:nucleoside-diphosphate kinase
MIEQTLCIIKPDVAMSRAPEILVGIIAAGMTPVLLQRVVMTPAQAARLYEAHVGQPYYAANIEFMVSGPSVAVVLEGEDACIRLRARIGSTDPRKAAHGTYRALYGTDLPRNAIHASENSRSASREIKIFFPHDAWRKQGERMEEQDEGTE